MAPEYLDASAVPYAKRQAFEAEVRRVYKQMARIVITPHWARFYDFGAGRLPPFLEALVNEASVTK